MKVIKGLHTEPVASDEQFFSSLVPNRKRKHSTQVLNTGRAVFLVQVQYRFRVAVSLIDVTACFQAFAKIRVIIDFAVVRNVKGAVFVRHRLMTTRDVDDAETAMAQTDRAVDENAFVIRTAMRNDIAHTGKHG